MFTNILSICGVINICLVSIVLMKSVEVNRWMIGYLSDKIYSYSLSYFLVFMTYPIVAYMIDEMIILYMFRNMIIILMFLSLVSDGCGKFLSKLYAMLIFTSLHLVVFYFSVTTNTTNVNANVNANVNNQTYVFSPSPYFPIFTPIVHPLVF